MTRAKVLWAELYPDELLERIDQFPVVFLPMGLCEPHGLGAAMGLDTLKAEGLCVEAARRFGGVVAPSQGYHIHETGYHARWLEETLGEVNPRMTSVPPGVLLHFLLYQLRAFHNAGFKAAVVLTGHAGGNERDLRLAAEAFMTQCSLRVVAVADSELVSGQFGGDHAGKYELSQLMALRPDLVDVARVAYGATVPPATHLGHFAQGSDAREASADYGRQIVEASLLRLGVILASLRKTWTAAGIGGVPRRMSIDAVEAVWCSIAARKSEWITASPSPDQPPVTAESQWRDAEYL